MCGRECLYERGCGYEREWESASESVCKREGVREGMREIVWVGYRENVYVRGSEGMRKITCV